MSKVINLEIYSCEFCPYLRYNGDYGRSYDSGYDCGHDDAPNDCRIVDDYDRKKRKKDPLSKVAKWCPLEDLKESNND